MIAESNIDVPFYFLRGYLCALEKIAGESSIFSASYFNTGPDLDSSIAAYFSEWSDDHRYNKRTLISYDRVNEILSTRIYSQLGEISKPTIARIDRYLQEQYKMVGAAVNPDGPFHPLVSGPVFELEIAHTARAECSVFLVQIGEYSIVTRLCTKTT